MNPKPVLFLLTLACLTLAACESNQPRHDDREAQTNRWMVEAINDTAIHNAIIAQRTLFPYHFNPGSADLNELGLRDLDVLAHHFADKSGQIIVQQGDASSDLYQARLASVAAALRNAGVPDQRVTLADGLPGGPGMDSVRVVRKLNTEPQPSTIYPPEQAVESLLRKPGAP